MIRKFSIVTLFLFFSFLSFAQSQELEYAKYDWEKNPKAHQLSKKEADLPEIVLKEKKATEFAFTEKGELLEYVLYHKINRVNSDKAIEQNNKIYIPSAGMSQFIKHQARVITPSGKVKVLSDSDIKEAVDENTKVKYRFFALVGIELGSEIEYLYYMKKAPDYTGDREVFQEDVPKKDVEFQLISPSNLIFKFKTYNTDSKVLKDTSIADKNVNSLTFTEIPALEKEEMSSYGANLIQVIYKLDQNLANNSKDIISYGPVSEGIAKDYFNVSDKSSKKKVAKFVQKIDIRFARDEEDKIRIIESYVKNNIAMLEHNNKAFDNLAEIIDNKVATQSGIVKLFSAIFSELQIDYQIVFTSNRKQIRFDPAFESYNFLAEYLIWFPGINKYIAPTNQISRLGFIPAEFTSNHGLFIKKVSLNEFTTGVGKIKFIEPIPYDQNYSNHYVTLDFKEDVTKPAINLEIQMNGYYAQYYQPFYSYMSDEDKKKVTESIITGFITDVEIKDFKVENEGKDFFGVKPFIVKSNITSNNLVEKAGDKLLFKVGELIGPQMEMYDDQQRTQEIESEYNRKYHRIITFELPAGYKITNPDILKMDVFIEENGERSTAFTSNYKVEGNKYIVEVTEYYKKINFPISQYENFRKVINAAADFNKLTLILQKK
jgi:hypothetical protein